MLKGKGFGLKAYHASQCKAFVYTYTVYRVYGLYRDIPSSIFVFVRVFLIYTYRHIEFRVWVLGFV